MNVSREIRLSELSGRLERGSLTFSELDQVAEEVAQIIRATSGKTQDAAKKIFEKSQDFKLQKVQEDVIQLERLGALEAKVRKLSLLKDEMTPDEIEKEIAEVAEEFSSMKPFFKPEMMSEAERVGRKIQDAEFESVFTVVEELGPNGQFAKELEAKANQLERI